MPYLLVSSDSGRLLLKWTLLRNAVCNKGRPKTGGTLLEVRRARIRVQLLGILGGGIPFFGETPRCEELKPSVGFVNKTVKDPLEQGSFSMGLLTPLSHTPPSSLNGVRIPELTSEHNTRRWKRVTLQVLGALHASGRSVDDDLQS